MSDRILHRFRKNATEALGHLDAVPRLGRRLAYCLYLGHHREGSRLQVCQAALA